MSMKGIEQHPGSRTPEASKCRRPEPPLHQRSFTSTPHCSRNCPCDARKRRNEEEDAMRRWLLEFNLIRAEIRHRRQKKENLKDSGIYSSNDSDKENHP
ncbi:unnamed protein product [Onchocerca ochengi]|uniref:BZIP domain-containing protein n=1 Tax=Onchocerca ochengi TaxID=42157 RepID=A0A182E8K4_ONCOC|nr:unnamed protein product [Onchocerca ochengi]